MDDVLETRLAAKNCAAPRWVCCTRCWTHVALWSRVSKRERSFWVFATKDVNVMNL